MNRRSVIRRARRRAWNATMTATPLETIRDEVQALSRDADAAARSLRIPARWRPLFEREYRRAGLAAIRAFEAWS